MTDTVPTLPRVHPILECERPNEHARIVEYRAGEDCHRFDQDATRIMVACCLNGRYQTGPLAPMARHTPEDMHDIASSALMGMMKLGGVVAYVLYDLPPHLRARWAPLPMDPSAMPPYSFVIYRRGIEPGLASGQQGFHDATYCMRIA
jgi:hypothetical protein